MKTIESEIVVLQNCKHCGEILNESGECKHYDECECGIMKCGFDDECNCYMDK